MGAFARTDDLTCRIKRFFRCESGEAIEYGLVASLITIMLIGGMAAWGGNLEVTYDGLSGAWGDSLQELEDQGMLDDPPAAEGEEG